MANKLPDSFCWAPYVNLDLDQDGSFYPCFRSKTRQGRWKEGNIIEEFNNESMQTLRDDLWNGRENSNCVQCHRREAEGVESTRQDFNKKFMDKVPDWKNILNTIASDHLVADISKLHSIEIRPHGMCTNACAHCDENSSSRWFKMQELDWDEFKTRYEDKPEVLEEFWKQAVNLQAVHFTGGDPLLYPKKHIKALEDIPNKNNIKLSYHSSLSLTPDERIFELWEEFKSVEVYASLDVSQKYFSYFRYGSDWTNVTENIAYVRENSKAEVIGVITVNVLTMMDIFPLVEYIIDNGMRIHVAFVDPPMQLSCVYLPNYLKKEAVLQLTRCKIKAKEYKDKHKEQKANEAFDNIHKFMYTHYDSEEFWIETLNLFSQLDGVYNKNIYSLSDKKIRHSKQVVKPKK